MDSQQPCRLRNVTAAIVYHSLHVLPFHPGKRRNSFRRLRVITRRQAQIFVNSQDLVGIRGLAQVVIGAAFHGRYRRRKAAVKDEARFPQKWAYFNFDRGERAPALPATSNCNSCHTSNAAVENTFVQFHPTLLEIATHKGTLNPTYLRQSASHQEPRP